MMMRRRKPSRPPRKLRRSLRTEYVEPPAEAKVYVGNLPYNIDSERLAQLFEQEGVVEVSEVNQ
uniref:RRM domain-containing protein n=2 Tax=Oryza TaxID=4527 RepID=A0A0E0QMQ7_ORYRU